MKLFKIVGIVLASFAILTLYAMVTYGAFAKITVVDETVPAMKMIGVQHVGPYQSVGTIMGNLYDDVKKSGVTGTQGLGIYFDSPEKVAPGKCRALVGQVIAEKDLPKLVKLSSKYKFMEIPELKAKVVHFPYHGQMSIIFAVTRVYPVLKAACGDSISVATMEIYDLPQKEILFVVPQNLTRVQQEQWLDFSTPANEATSLNKDSL